MRTILVVVGQVLGQNLLEMARTEDEDSVEALSAGRANKTFGDRDRDRARGSNGRADDSDALRAEGFIEAGGELGVSVSTRNLTAWERSESTHLGKVMPGYKMRCHWPHRGARVTCLIGIALRLGGVSGLMQIDRYR
jgi:hypothetical protein